MSLKQTAFRPNGGIRDAIIAKQRQVSDLAARGVISARSEAAFLVKPDTSSTYDDFVRIMDELNITGVTRKAVVDITPAEQALIASFAAGGGAPTSLSTAPAGIPGH